MNSDLDRTIRTAVAERRVLQFMYDSHARVVEPHDYGIHKGTRKVLCYQIAGGSGSGKVPDWRTFFLDKIARASIGKATFAGARPVPGKHIDWDELFASVSRKPFNRRR